MRLDEIVAMHRAGELEAAEQAYFQWLKEHPAEQENFHLVWNKLGSLYFMQQKWHEAIEAYQRAIMLRADYLDAYYNLGLALVRSHQYEQAMITWQALLELSPQHAGGHFQVGCLLMRRHQYTEALNQFLKIQKQDAAYVEAQANLATCSIQLGWLDEAKKYYLNVLEILSEDANTLYNLGVVHAQQGDLDEAIQYYQLAVAAEPNLFAAHNNLGAIYLSRKDRAAAQKHFQEALRIQPDNEAVRHILAVIASQKDITKAPAAYVANLFDSYADHYDAHLSSALQYQVPAQMYDMMQHVVSLPTHQWQVLDVGCGTGLCGQYFRSAASELTGVDLSEKMLAVAHSKKLYDKLVQEDVLTFLQKQKTDYDLIIAGDVLVYMGDLSPVFAAAHQALKPSGYFMFNVEAANDGNFYLTTTGRFAHSKVYIDKLIAAHHFQLLAFHMITLRLQDGRPVPGFLYLCSSSHSHQ